MAPWHWYWTSALPRAALAALPLAPLGAVLDSRARPAAAAAFLYVALYSLLPHKEVGGRLLGFCLHTGAHTLRAHVLCASFTHGTAACKH